MGKYTLLTLVDKEIERLKQLKTGIFENQFEAAREIIESWDNSDVDLKHNRHVILNAQTQVGKTGVYIALIRILKEKAIADQLLLNSNNVFILTGMNENDLKEQMIKDLVKKGDFTKEEATNLVKKNGDMASEIEKDPTTVKTLENALIIIDESHYGNKKENNILPKFIDVLGLDQQASETLEKSKIFVVSVSATPFIESVSDPLAIKPSIILKPGPNYWGAAKFIENGNIFQSESKIDWVNETLEKEFKLAIDNYHGNAMIVLRVASRRKAEVFRDRWESVVSVKDYYGHTIDFEKLQLILKDIKNNREKGKSNQPTLVIIVGSMRAGLNFDFGQDFGDGLKPYISAVIDTAQSDPHAAVQGLFGRVCGYYPATLPSVKIYTNKEAIEAYKDWIDKGYPRDTEQWAKKLKSGSEFKTQQIKFIEIDLTRDTHAALVLNKFVESRTRKTKREDKFKILEEFNNTEINKMLINYRVEDEKNRISSLKTIDDMSTPSVTRMHWDQIEKGVYIFPERSLIGWSFNKTENKLRVAFGEKIKKEISLMIKPAPHLQTNGVI